MDVLADVKGRYNLTENQFRKSIYISMRTGKSLFYSLTVLLVFHVFNVQGLVVPDLSKHSNLTSSKRVYSLGFSIRKLSSKKDNATANSPNSGLISGLSPEVAVTIQDKWAYITNLYVGSDQQEVEVEIDTGSSDLWIRSQSAGGSYNPSSSSTFKQTNNTFDAYYFDDSYAKGKWAYENVALAKDAPTVKGLQFGYATDVTTSNNIFGIGFKNLESTVYGGNGAVYNNFPAALKAQGLVNKNAYSLYLNSQEATEGTLIFGGVDKAKYDGPLVEFDLTGKANRNRDNYRMDITLDSVSAEGQTGTLNAPVTLDSGTTYTILNQDIYNAMLKIFKPQYSSKYQVDIISCDQPDKEVEFKFGDLVIKVPYSDFADQLYQNGQTKIDGVCVFALSSTNDEYILGDNFLRHAYVVYDLEDRKISMAQVKYTSESDIQEL